MKSRLLTFTLFCFLAYVSAAAINIKGRVTDKSTKEPLIGATVMIEGTTHGVTTDWDGYFEIESEGNTCILKIQYVSYATVTIKVTAETAGEELAIELEPEQLELQEVMVTAQARRNTEASLINAARQSLVVQSGVSAQQIKKTQDSNASEVIKRVPGISIIDDKFVMVRGLAQRYNNVWINGSAVPSTEADSRAFSFDIIPSSQLDNMMIIKSPAPEYPADFSGGFILINTKDIPSENSFSVSVGGGINDATHFSDFFYNKRSGTDFLGFDNGLRSLHGGIGAKLRPIAGTGTDLLGNGLNNDWRVRKIRPVANASFSIGVNRFWENESGRKIALLGALNYSDSYQSFTDMENSMYGAYDETHDQSNYLRKSTDDQYNHNNRVGAMLNLTFVPVNNNNRFELKNIFNQIGKDRYTYRSGISAQSNLEESAEYYYSSRTTYNGQFTAKHLFDDNRLNWNVGYAYANRNLPDRRRYLIDNALESSRLGLTTGNDINREFTKLNEHIFSANLNYERQFAIGNIQPTVKAGAYGEYRTRDYKTRSFIYNWNTSSNSLPQGFRYMDIPTELMDESNYGADKLYLLEEVKMRNDYSGDNMLGAAYAAINLPFGKFNVYAGLRFEHNTMKLTSNTRDYEVSPLDKYYRNNDIFPSVNATYKLNDKHQLRLAYGKSVNRPEFREVSSSVFYDFDLASNVQGNPDLKSCYVHNLDFRYELYTAPGEQISIAAFFKHFADPIEWTYTVTGGTDMVYSYQNADKAISYGIEVDIKKNLDFMGMKDFTLLFNGSLIKSKVMFSNDPLQKDRPMQGQSPYLINAGLFYQHPETQWSASVLYNRIGKRLVGVGRSMGTSNDDIVNIPDSYEMPRNTIDINVGKNFGDHWELKFGIRDLLAEKAYFKQFADVELNDGSKKKIEEINKCFNPGRTFNLSVSFKF